MKMRIKLKIFQQKYGNENQLWSTNQAEFISINLWNAYE